MFDFKPTIDGIKKAEQTRKNNGPFSPKASTCLSMQETLANALGGRMPQNNGAQIVQPGTTQGFGRSM